jgi:SAM-dependent methyltransferase
MNFDRLARHYNWLEAVTAGRQLQRMRTHWLDALADRPRILSVGEGHGRFAAACMARFPQAELTCVEASPAMLAVAQRRTHGMPGRVRWQCSDILEWQTPGRYDAIVTCFFLDCFPPHALADVIGHLSALATDDAVWLLSDFAVPACGPARLRAQAIHTLMYWFFRVCATLPARSLSRPDSDLRRHGFELTGEFHSEWGLLRSDLWRRTAPATPHHAPRASSTALYHSSGGAHPCGA